MGLDRKVYRVIEKTSESTGIPKWGVMLWIVAWTVIWAHTVLDMVTYDDAPQLASPKTEELQVEEAQISQKQARELLDSIQVMIEHYTNGGYLRYKHNYSYLVHVDSTNLIENDNKYYIFEIWDGHTHEITDFDIIETKEVE